MQRSEARRQCGTPCGVADGPPGIPGSADSGFGVGGPSAAYAAAPPPASAATASAGPNLPPRPRWWHASAPRGEEVAQQRGALLGADAGDDLGAVVEPGFGEHVEDT